MAFRPGVQETTEPGRSGTLDELIEDTGHEQEDDGGRVQEEDLDSEVRGEPDDEEGGELEDEWNEENQETCFSDDISGLKDCGCSATDRMSDPNICYYCGTNREADVSDDSRWEEAPRCGVTAGITWPLCKLKPTDWRVVLFDMVHERLLPWYEAVRRNRATTALPYCYGVGGQVHHRVQTKDLPSELMSLIIHPLDPESKYMVWATLATWHEAVEYNLRECLRKQDVSSQQPIAQGNVMSHRCPQEPKPEEFDGLEAMLEESLTHYRFGPRWFIPARIHQSPQLSESTIQTMNELYTATNSDDRKLRRTKPRWLDLSQVRFNPHFTSLFPGRISYSFGHCSIELIPDYDHLTESPRVYDPAYFSMIANMFVTSPPCEVLGIYNEEWGISHDYVQQIGRVVNVTGVTIRDLWSALRYSTREGIDAWIGHTERDLKKLAKCHCRPGDAKGRRFLLDNMTCGPSPRLRIKLEPRRRGAESHELSLINLERLYRGSGSDRWQRGVWHDVFRSWFSERLRQPAAWDDYIKTIRLRRSCSSRFVKMSTLLRSRHPGVEEQ